MFRQRFLLWIMCFSLALAVPSYGAEKRPTGNPPTVVEGGPSTCDLAVYKSEDSGPIAVAVPDNDPAGVDVGTLQSGAFDGTRFTDIIVDLRMSHTYVNDLVATVTYHDPCDGPALAFADILLFPPCEGDLDGTTTYFFSDGAACGLGASCGCPATLPGGCYQPSILNALSGFDGLFKGGCWKLNIADLAQLDLGLVTGWSVHMLQAPTSTHLSSWGSVKTLYR
ncbi:MAG TPA: hypothetical protein VEY91_04200 [Candidatus Limnocylindria bacterium]|nr:hypothetical protein [Candidatus Limnocylindria bacterium]